MFSVFINGMITGLLLQIAVGPVFFYVLNISLQRTLSDSIWAVLAVTIADYIYIFLAVAGVGKLLENGRIKSVLGVLSSVVLIGFGLVMIYSADKSTVVNAAISVNAPDYLSSFFSSFLLTISSPLTIVFWTGLFAAKAIEKNYSRDQLIVFGLSAGLATLFFLGTAVIIFSFVKTSIPMNVIYYLNIFVGIILIAYAVFRFVKMYKGLVGM